MDIISKKLANGFYYAYHEGRFWRWDVGRKLWKESRLMKQKYDLNHEVDKLLTPEDFLSDPVQFQALEDYEVDFILKDALAHAEPGKPAPISPVETLPDTPAATEVAAPCGNTPAAPGFDFGADEHTNALLLQDAQTFITGNMARIMAAKHAHDLCANNRNGTWGRWCNAVGISRDTGDRMVNIAAQCGNIQIDGQSIFDVRPMKLLYAAAKPSTPDTVKQAVFSGDITTYKEYQELMEQLKAEKERTKAAEAREEEAWNMVSKAQGEAKAAKDDLDHEIAQTDALLEEKGRLLRECEAAKKARMDAEARADTAESERDAATADVNGLYKENSRLNAEKEQALQRAAKAEEALKHQPITAVVDEEEVDRRAAEKAWGLADARNAELQEDIDDLKQQLAKAKATPPADLIADKETADGCVINIEGVWSMALPAFSRLVGTGDTLNNVAERLITLCDRIHAQAVQLIIKNDKETQDE